MWCSVALVPVRQWESLSGVRHGGVSSVRACVHSYICIHTGGTFCQEFALFDVVGYGVIDSQQAELVQFPLHERWRRDLV